MGLRSLDHMSRDFLWVGRFYTEILFSNYHYSYTCFYLLCGINLVMSGQDRTGQIKMQY